MFLGLDLSTQQLKGVVIDDQLKLRYETVVAFDEDLPGYKTRKGVYVRGKQVLSPVALWVEALDLLCARMKEQQVPLHQIRSVSGSGQQHGSVWWSDQAESKLASLQHDKSLVEQLVPASFTYDLSPNWQDASTQAECDELEACVGGANRLAEITGSKAHHRFTGPQILRLRKTQPDIYSQTARISLVSSFLCSLLLGQITPIDASDVCGANLWDIRNECYHKPLMDLVSGGNAGDLAYKLGEVCMDGGRKLGRISSYFVEKYGFHKDCDIVPFTGDNPATILSLPLRERDAMISLGTSTTMLLSTPHFVPSPAYHLFAHPTTVGLHMAMLCYKNGSLAREQVRDAINAKQPIAAGQDPWQHFNELAKQLGFYFTLPEIIPLCEAGTWRFDRKNGLQQLPPDSSSTWHVPEDDARAILESQFLDIRLRSKAFFDPDSTDATSTTQQPDRIYVVGGSSRNPAIVQALGDVLGGQEGVYRQLVGASNACALGGANKAAWASLRQPQESFEDFVGRKWDEQSSVEKLGVGYDAKTWELYGEMLGDVAAAEALIVDGRV
ncbi:hypothetical protein BCR37DRAFT_403210 [Protomyces lactucae-debilis]|uniref:Xylulose kinase n=1 Tax=Protomyces lactucae-debilis TaxID=2754530 RepID=A0A1Y2F9L2_PROLT|nr:uncharacterized protein BCR37DRAFT_403210 [Protomyces lactucae-debilis]ORY80016.1 hypothetical protein BCR37DRAFT_403210 [Protomyces lactucae-debilis]